MALARLQQRTTPETVADALREAILNGTLAPGSHLRETSIAGDLGISRAPLRETLRSLEQEGLIVKIPFKGAFVAEVSEKSISDIAHLRSILEPWAIEQGLSCLQQSERLAELRGIIDRLAAAAREGKAQESVSGHLAFHRVLYEAAGNEVLTNLWRDWENQLRLFLAADQRQAGDPMAVYRNHAVLLAAIEDGDLRSIRTLLASHIHGANDAVLGEPSAAARQTARTKTGAGTSHSSNNGQSRAGSAKSKKG